MKVILYQPRSVDPPNHRLPLSLLALVSALDRHDVTLIDANLVADGVGALLASLPPSGTPVLVGMTVHPGRQLASALADLRSLKAARPDTTVVWGGYFPSMHPRALLSEPGIDYCVVGQGERAIAELADACEAQRQPAVLPGLFTREELNDDDGELPPAEPYSIRPYGRLPFSRLSMDDYLVPTGLGTRTANYMASYGCPYRCNFCAIISVYRSRWVSRPLELLRSDIVHLVRDHGANAIEFHDPTFFLGEKRVRAICDILMGLGVRWSGQGRVDTMLGYSPSTWRAIRASGCGLIYFGAESGDDELLEEMSKDSSVANTLQIARLTRDYGLRPEFYFCFGNPSDPERSIRANMTLIHAIKEINPQADICPTIYTPTPQPGMSESPEAAGLAYPKTLEDWTKPPWTTFGFMQRPQVPWLSDEQVQRIRTYQLVLNSAWPRHGDLRLGRVSRRIGMFLGRRRYARGAFDGAPELQLFDKAVTRLAPRWNTWKLGRGA